MAHIFTVGNIKGGAGKTTFSMHLISGLIELGFSVASIDTDIHQHSLTRYINNRKISASSCNEKLSIPYHFLIDKIPESKQNQNDVNLQEKNLFEDVLEQAKKIADIVVIDTPGSFCNLSCIAHSYADVVITPINDSFLDLDLLAEVDSQTFQIKKLSIYSEMIWQQKLHKAKRDGGTIEWIIVRNRLSNIDAHNKRAVAKVMDSFAKKMKCYIGSGFKERVIFRELFLKGMTLLDIEHAQQRVTLSHIAARQELREFLNCLGIEKLRSRYSK